MHPSTYIIKDIMEDDFHDLMKGYLLRQQKYLSQTMLLVNEKNYESLMNVLLTMRSGISQVGDKKSLEIIQKIITQLQQKSNYKEIPSMLAKIQSLYQEFKKNSEEE